MQVLTDLIAQAQSNLNTEFDPMNVPDLTAVDLKAFGKETIVELIWSMRRYPSVYRTYIGEANVTKDELRDAIISVTYDKISRGGRKYSGGARYLVVIDHSKLPLNWDNNTRTQEHPVILTPRKYRGQPKHWVETNIFDGKKVA